MEKHVQLHCDCKSPFHLRVIQVELMEQGIQLAHLESCSPELFCPISRKSCFIPVQGHQVFHSLVTFQHLKNHPMGFKVVVHVLLPKLRHDTAQSKHFCTPASQLGWASFSNKHCKSVGKWWYLCFVPTTEYQCLILCHKNCKLSNGPAGSKKWVRRKKTAPN